MGRKDCATHHPCNFSNPENFEEDERAEPLVTNTQEKQSIEQETPIAQKFKLKISSRDIIAFLSAS
ncbi:hypothetical protein KIN20_010227 [Parelaphostrongylus tenuis]|uniref:Uncharacterized protein n=1 Tax=Parelaphostrongylus tenuis TaxID=148309 RepID=A0AAD5QLA7_PARTN|nr:hypothetical protein KIN20_010227 [Parelaphostrongylus tenuis]